MGCAFNVLKTMASIRTSPTVRSHLYRPGLETRARPNALDGEGAIGYIPGRGGHRRATAQLGQRRSFCGLHRLGGRTLSRNVEEIEAVDGNAFAVLADMTDPSKSSVRSVRAAAGLGGLDVCVDIIGKSRFRRRCLSRLDRHMPRSKTGGCHCHRDGAGRSWPHHCESSTVERIVGRFAERLLGARVRTAQTH